MAALFVKHLTVLDFSYVHAERGILGESWIVDVELHGALDDQGMVFDFGDVKKRVKQALEDLFDHKLVIPNTLPGFERRHDSATDQLTLSWQDKHGEAWQHSSPASAVYCADAAQITPAALIPALTAAAAQAVPDNVADIVITLRTEEISGASYQYSHGLKKHGGNCQRIAHGHRSRLKILRNDKRDPLLEQAWALKWQDIYIGTEEDLVSAAEDAQYCFRYEAQQGLFELTLPARHVYLIDTDTTVEYLADHMAAALKADDPDHRFEVHAYEGVMKGAIARR